MTRVRALYDQLSIGMRLSLLLHGGILLALLLQMYLPRPRLEVPDAMSVSLMDAKVLNQRTAAPKRAEKAPQAPKPIPARTTPPPPKAEPPAPKPEPVKAEPPPPAPKPEPVVAAPAPKPEPKEEPKPAPPKKAEVKKPEPPKKVETTPPPRKQEPVKPADDFAQNILKTLQDARTPTPAPATVNAPESLEQALSGDELSALRRQIGQCWNFPAGARSPEELVVTLDITMNADRTVRRATLARDATRYSNDAFFRAAADSALRAMLSPECTPLQLPPGKFNEWQRFTITFDPRQMVGF